MSFGRFRLLTALSASSFCLWKRAECTSPDQSTNKEKRVKQVYDAPSPHCRTGCSKRLSPHDFSMALAFLASSKSKDGDKQIGACIVTDGEPLFLAGLGYNGMPDGPGFKDYETEYLKPPKHKLECHAEVNTIISAFRRHADLSKSTLYTTHSPCSGCCKLITQSGIKKVFWAKEYDEEVEEHMKPIRDSTKRPEKRGKARFSAVEQYLKPLKDMNIEEYHGKSKIEIDLGPSLWGKYLGSETKLTDHCKITASQRRTRGNDDQNGEGTDQTREETKKESGLRGEGKRKVDITKDDFFMAIAKLATTQSTSESKVGACLVTLDPHRAVSIGYSEIDEPSCYKTEKEESYQMQRCAESMAITSAFRVHADLTSSVLYVTSPLCSYCARIVVQSGVKTVIYYSEEKDKTDEDERKTVKEIFDRAKILYVKYRRQKKKRHIMIDLANKKVEVED